MTASVPTTPVPSDLVAFVAHPDDAEIHCGGTLALAAAQGWRAAIVDFTRGELSTRGTPERRAEEAAEAAAVLGLACRVQLGLPDGHVRDDDDARRQVVALLRRMRPRVVIAPPASDHHADHVAVAEIVSRSVYLAGVARYAPEADGPEPWRPRCLLHHVGTRPAIPDLVVDVSAVFEQRMRAMRCYRSQFHAPESDEKPTRVSHPEFLAWVEGALRRHGFLIGVSHGEAYTTPEPVPVTDVIRQLGADRWSVAPETS